VYIFARKKYVRNVYQNFMGQMHMLSSENFISGAQQKERKKERKEIHWIQTIDPPKTRDWTV
jgi:hypothetical protein